MVPFEFILTASDQGRYRVQCSRLLRTIAGRRNVFEGVCDDRAVIVKRFEDLFGEFRCHREKRGLQRLRQRGLPAPKVLLGGKDEKGHDVLIIEKINHAEEVLTAVKTAAGEDGAKAIALAIFYFMAQMHQAGAAQYDLHLGNYLWAEGRIWAIDPARIKFRRKPLGPAETRLQLAMLTAAVPQSLRACEEVFLRAYCESRGLDYTEAMRRDIQLRRAGYQQRKLPHTLKKTLRNSKKFGIFSVKGCRGVFYKEQVTVADAERLAEKLTSDVIWKNREGHIELAGERYRAKRYPAAFVLGSMRPSPARRQWRAMWQRHYSGQQTPRPILLAERPKGLCTVESWLVTEPSRDQR